MEVDTFKSGYHFLKLQNAKETENSINHYHENQNDIKQIAENGKKFFCDTLSPESVLAVWAEILKEYSKKCNFEVKEPRGEEFLRNDYKEAD